MLLLLACSCSTVHHESAPMLEQEVAFGWSQVLLRDVIAGLNEEVEGNIKIGPKLNEIADITITFIPSSEESHNVNLAVALDYLRNYVAAQYEITTRWRQDGDTILFYFDGQDEEYDELPKRDSSI
jgi:hypothetical protein